jgi:hypothetical protein
VAVAVLAPLPRDPCDSGLRDLLGPAAWGRLPPAVRRRFATHAAAEYVGTFEVVHASRMGLLIAQLCRLIGTPVVPHTGRNVSACVSVIPELRGTCWVRKYHWPHGTSTVRSTKVIDARDGLIEVLSAGLCMALEVFERDGALHFVSRRYFFELPLPGAGRTMRFALPHWLSPGITHVEHRDEGGGCFRFTMRVQHGLLGETYYQTGLFHAAGEPR